MAEEEEEEGEGEGEGEGEEERAVGVQYTKWEEQKSIINI